MAKVKEMSFGKSIKISQNYNSIDAHFSITIELGDEDTDTAGIKQMGWDTVDAQMAKQTAEAIEVLQSLPRG